MSGEGPVPPEEKAYSYRPSLLGAPYEFRLGEQALEWRVGNRSGHVPWREVERVRLSFRPVSMQRHRFVAEIWAAGAPKLTVMSSSWKSMMVQERRDESYAGFIAGLHRHLAQAQSRAVFEQGTNPLRYWPGVAVFAAVSLGLAVLVVRALQAQTFGGAIFVAAFLVLFLWRGGEYFRRNRPRLYRADAPPADLIPTA
jgi:hypothetical protein